MIEWSIMEKLHIFGGPKAINSEFKSYNSMGNEEVEAAVRVIRSGVLSKFIGANHPDFLGGEKVREFEEKCAKYFGVKYAVTVNSWTSGLIAAIGAIGIEPGDEVIVTPWTMCASATAILHWNAIPVFADIEEKTFNLDLASIEKNISPYTKAIMCVDIFGHSANMTGVMELANKYGLKVISDTAQAPGAFYGKKYAGTLAHIGGYSLNYHKHIHTGEGGVIVTDDDNYAKKLRLIRNHAEAVVSLNNEDILPNMIGYNFRLGEIECAIGIEQLGKLRGLVARRQELANLLTAKLSKLPGLRTPIVFDNCTHAYYMYGLILDVAKLGVKRSRIVEALRAEGVPGLTEGYANIHMLPMYQKKIGYGSIGFPWTSDICKREVSYEKGICPVAETLQDQSFFSFAICMYEISDEEALQIAYAFEKVWANLNGLLD